MCFFFLLVGLIWLRLCPNCFVQPAPLKASIFRALSQMAFLRTDMAHHPDGTTHICSSECYKTVTKGFCICIYSFMILFCLSQKYNCSLLFTLYYLQGNVRGSNFRTMYT
uniref:Putative secreted peptide n=1 Tax=Anopheles braziliensis TaxID=58242 RepID=A0A2M3ZT05_9DIPT